jgi:hypothetical protein
MTNVKDALVVFVAIGFKEHFFNRNIEFFPNQDCITYTYNKHFLGTHNCTTIYKNWSWTRFLYDVNNYIRPNHKYVTIILDDIKIINYDFEKVVEQMKEYEESISSPNVRGSYYNFYKRKIPNFTEIFLTTFSINAWKCWWDMMNYFDINFDKTVGWGFDLCYSGYCNHVTHITSPFEIIHKISVKTMLQKKIGTYEVSKYKKLSKKINKLCIKQLR